MEIQDKSYQALLLEVKNSIRAAQITTGKYVNRSMITLYWHIGQMITERQEKEGWGKSVVELLSKDLKKEFPNQQGFSVQNLWFMRQFYLMYRNSPILQQAVREIPWSHNIIIMNKIKNTQEQQFYLESTAKFGWSREILRNQINANAYKTLKIEPKTHNFQQTLSQNLAEQAQEALKSEYNLDFLGLSALVRQRESPCFNPLGFNFVEWAFDLFCKPRVVYRGKVNQEAHKKYKNSYFILKGIGALILCFTGFPCNKAGFHFGASLKSLIASSSQP